MASNSNGSRLDQLPNELLNLVIRQCPDIPTLYGLTQAHGRARELFERDPNGVIADAVYGCSMHPQLKQMFCTLLSIRQRNSEVGSVEDLKSFLDRHINTSSIDLRLDLHGPKGGISFLKNASQLCEQIDRAERSCIETWISMFDGHNLQQRPYLTKNLHPSETELHRIRRAIWRLCLYYETFYIRFLPEQIDLTNETFVNLQEGFFYRLTDWELEELECVWCCLNQNPSIYWNQTCPYCHTILLPDNLKWHRVHGCATNDSDAFDFEGSCTWFRQDLEYGLQREFVPEGPPAWPNSLACRANAGFCFLQKYERKIWPEEDPGPYRIPRVSCLSWGYCMWDRKRLEGLRLVHSKDKKVRAEFERWRECDSSDS